MLPWYYRGVMLSTKTLMRIMDRGFLMKALYSLLFYSLVPVGEIALILYLKVYWDGYLLLTIVLASGLLGAVIAWKLISLSLKSVSNRVKTGTYPREEFSHLAGSLVAGVLLVTPGFVTDALGLLFILPVLRHAIGSAIASRWEPRLKELYEYMKL